MWNIEAQIGTPDRTQRHVGFPDILGLYGLDRDRKNYYLRILHGFKKYLFFGDNKRTYSDDEKNLFLNLAANDLARNTNYLMKHTTAWPRLIDPKTYYGDMFKAWVWVVDHSSRSDIHRQEADQVIKEASSRVRAERTNGASNDKVRVTEVGSAGGRDYYWLAKKHPNIVDYTGVDMSPAMVKIAREIHPEGKFILGNVLSLSELVSHKQAAVYASALLHHLKEKDLWKAMKQIRQVLADNGVFYASLRNGKRPMQDPTTGLLYYCRTQNKLLNMLRLSGFNTIDMALQISPTVEYITFLAEAV
jgi:SAM-dependent methyltransferase